jgi:hypothetical protein
MKITHQQARRVFETALNIALFYGQKPELDTTLSEHLARCPECRAYAEQASGIDAQLAQHLPDAWQIPIVSSKKLEQAIHQVHGQVRSKPTTNRQNFWGGIQHAWQWGIGLAGIAILVGVLYLGMRLLPQNTSAPGVAQPSLTNPILPTQTTVPTPTATQALQKSGKPMDGEWVARTDFGKLTFTIGNTGTRIKKVDYQFSEWTCGSTYINSSEIVDASDFMITNNRFLTQTTFDRALQSTMDITGTYEATNQKLTGTWEAAMSGTVCSGTWEASLLPSAP